MLGIAKRISDLHDCTRELDKLQTEVKAFAERDHRDQDSEVLKVAAMNRVMALLTISHSAKSKTVKESEDAQRAIFDEYQQLEDLQVIKPTEVED